jgi:branched-subunit amino acid ABC-type transport system permease component
MLIVKLKFMIMKSLYFILFIICFGTAVIGGMMSYFGNVVGDYIVTIFALLSLCTSSGYRAEAKEGE